MAEMKNQYCFIARIVIETKAPLTIGSGNKSIKTDSLVLRDVNGLPFIPGTTIAGLLRHSLDKKEQDLLMGSQKEGSRLIITEARILDENGNVLDGMLSETELNTEFLSHFRKQMTIRQHVRINHKGTAVKYGKFDEEVVLKGARFCFEMEMISNDAEDSKFKRLLNTFASDSFRIGSGSRSGFGEIEVVGNKCQYMKINMSDGNQRLWYLEKSASLSESWKDCLENPKSTKDPKETIKYEIEELTLKSSADGWILYTLNIKPEDFLLFGSGFGDEEGNADMSYVKEKLVDWSNGTGEVKSRKKILLIPGSSVKGAISHRTAFYYNKVRQIIADNLPDGKTINDFVGGNNPAVVALFGSEGTKVDGKMQGKQRGNVLISDVIEVKELSGKYLNHVSIDRFTGGAIDGALFTEEVLYAKGEEILINLLVNKKAFQDVIRKESEIIIKSEEVRKAFESALDDICSGLLPLGGGVNRGNGCFKGSWTKKELNSKEEKK